MVAIHCFFFILRKKQEKVRCLFFFYKTNPILVKNAYPIKLDIIFIILKEKLYYLYVMI